MTSQKVVNNPLGSYPVKVTRTSDNSLVQHVTLDNSLIPGGYDDIELSYNVGGELIGVEYLLGGVTQATLTLTYSLGFLTSVVRS